MFEDAVEYLCRNVDALRELVPPVRWDAAFAVIRDEDPTGDPWRDAVRELHETITAAGVPGGLGLHTTLGDHWPPAPTAQSVGWICPTRRCARVDLRDSLGQPAPRCALDDRPMQLVES
jgi:hypothetical protein